MKALVRRMASLRFSILGIVLLCWLAPTLLLGGYMGGRFFTAFQDKTEDLLMTKAQQAQVRVMENIDAVVKLAKDVVYDDTLSAAVSAFESNEITYEVYFSACRSYLEHKFGRERLLEFALFFRTRNPNNVFFTSDDYLESVYFQNHVQGDVLELSTELDTGNCFFREGGRMYLVRNLFNTRMEKYGMIVLGLNEDMLFAPAEEACAEMEVDYMLQLDRFVHGDTQHADASPGMSEQGESLLYTLDSATRDYSLRFQVQADKNEVYREIGMYRALMLWMLMLLVPICLLVMLFLNKRIIRPIRLLSEASTRIRGGELGITVPMHGTDELGQLGSAFSSMSVQLKELVDKSYKEEIALRDARIQALQSRVNAHFLNNALETINWEARMEGSETISDMVEALSCLLNASMDRNERHLMPIRDELAVADAYFFFIALRFGERLTVYRHIADDVSDALAPRLAIQTLVENAIEHGIAPMGGGRISLSAYAREGMLTVEVVNTGKRLTLDDLARIRALMDEDVDTKGHMGIRNVAHRLRLLYGTSASMRIDVDARGQTVVCFSIPLQRQREGDRTYDESK